MKEDLELEKVRKIVRENLYDREIDEVVFKFFLKETGKNILDVLEGKNIQQQILEEFYIWYSRERL